jgi:hypothetical protein
MAVLGDRLLPFNRLASQAVDPDPAHAARDQTNWRSIGMARWSNTFVVAPGFKKTGDSASSTGASRRRAAPLVAGLSGKDNAAGKET